MDTDRTGTRLILLLLLSSSLLQTCSAALLRVPPGFRAAPQTQAEPYTGTGWASETIHDATGIAMVFVPAGEFLMGSPEDEEGRENGNIYGGYALTGRNDEGPQHPVTISNAFYMAKFELTRAEWNRVMGIETNLPPEQASLPVHSAMQDDCTSLLTNLNAMGSTGFRLPTEAEWEYACRAGTTTPFGFGSTLNPDQANYNASYSYGNGKPGLYRKRTTPVGSFPPNAWGLHDMHGNVWERCATLYGLYPTNAPHVNLKGMNVLRGGAWYCRPGLCRSANRYPEPSFHRGAGLRVLFEP